MKEFSYSVFGIMGVRWGLGVEAVSAIIFIISENKSPTENTFNGQLGL